MYQGVYSKTYKGKFEGLPVIIKEYNFTREL